MKIISVNIQSFGKLKDVNIRFNDGLNVLRQVNGFGKTTLAGFIRAMLYGFTYRSKNGVNDASHFAPWDGNGRFGGSMMVEHNGSTYRIERFFGSTARQESFTFTDEKTNRQLSTEHQPGELLLGLTADSYDRSAYFPQEAVTLESNSNFDNRLANLVQNGAEDYDKVQDRLRAYRKNLRYEKGSGGLIYDLDCQRQALERQMESSRQAERRASEIDRRMQQMEADRESLLDRQDEYRKQQEALQRQLAQAQPTDEERRRKARASELKDKISRIPQEFEQDVVHCNAIADEIARVKAIPAKQTNKFGTIVIGICALLILVGVVLVALGAASIVDMIVGIVVGAAIAAIGIAGAVLKFKLKKRTKQPEQPINFSVDQLVSQYMQIAKKYVYTDERDYDTVKRQLWEAFAAYQGDVREYNALLPTVSRPQVDTSQIEQQISNTNNVLAALQQSLSELAMEEGRLTEERRNLNFGSVGVADKLAEIDHLRKQAVHRYEVADAVSKILAQAKENLSSSYLPRLCARCTQLLREITDTDYAVALDRNFSVSIREKGHTKPMSEFSRGTREIALLCFRVALSELLYDGAIPFIVIDDAFVNFDENNFVRATTLLNKLATHAQVIYFTCHARAGNLRN